MTKYIITKSLKGRKHRHPARTTMSSPNWSDNECDAIVYDENEYSDAFETASAIAEEIGGTVEVIR